MEQPKRYTKREKELISFFHRYNTVDDTQIACYVDEKPYSWNVVYLEVINYTKLSIRMLRKIKWNKN